MRLQGRLVLTRLVAVPMALEERRCSSHRPLTGRPNEPHINCCHSLPSGLSERNPTMNDDDPPSPHETVPARAVSSATSGPPASSPDSSASVTMAKQLRRPRVRRLLSNRRSRWIMAAAPMCAVIGLSACGTASATATSPSATAAGSGSAGGLGSGGGGSNARSGPAAGGASGTVGSVSTSSFTISTSAGQVSRGSLRLGSSSAELEDQALERETRLELATLILARYRFHPVFDRGRRYSLEGYPPASSTEPTLVIREANQITRRSASIATADHRRPS